MALLSRRTERIASESAFKIGPLIRQLEDHGKKVIKRNLGEPDFPIPAAIKDEAKQQFDKDKRTTVIRRGSCRCGRGWPSTSAGAGRVPAAPERVVVVLGAKPPIGFAQQTYCNPGDEVVYPSPGFPIYESFVRYVGAVPKPIHLDEVSAATRRMTLLLGHRGTSLLPTHFRTRVMSVGGTAPGGTGRDGPPVG